MTRRVVMAGAAVSLALTGAGASASTAKPMDQSAIERSWAVQAELARIEENKEAFVDELLASWAPYVDGSRIDLQGELKAIAMAAYPWRLYGASLVGDYKTMVRILRGKAGAAQYVNALDKPESKVRYDPSKILGDTNNSLVFTPMAPCRIVDTRGTGARTGILVPGTPRVFDMTSQGLTEGQGGDTVCAGIATFSHLGWSANVTTTGYASIGGLQIYPSAGAPPSSSFINFFPAGYAIANSGSLTGCYACADDITVSTFGASTHVIIDLMGFYEEATGFTTGPGSLAVTAMAGTSTSIPANSAIFINGGDCPAGTLVVSGGQSNGGSGNSSVDTSDHNRSGTHWTEYLNNPSAGAISATVTTYCIDIN